MRSGEIEGAYVQLVALTKRDRHQLPPSKIHPRVLTAFLTQSPQVINDGSFKLDVVLGVDPGVVPSLPWEAQLTEVPGGFALAITGLQLLQLLDIPQVLSITQ